MRILVAEDDVRLAAVLEESLVEAGWTVDVVHDGRSAYDRLLRDGAYDVALLDWMLPQLDGVSVARRLRDLGVASTPIMMLTARGDVRDRIEGLDAGADDYLPKPFDLDELLARLRALHRRGSLANEAPCRWETWWWILWRAGSPAVALTLPCRHGSSTSSICSPLMPVRW